MAASHMTGSRRARFDTPHAAPADDGGHRGSFTRGNEMLQYGMLSEPMSPPVNSDANPLRPRTSGLAAWLVLSTLITLSVLWVAFRWLLVR